MKHINRAEFNSILEQNENENIYFDKLKVIFQYELTDNQDNNITQKATQDATGVKINGKEYVILTDQYSDYFSQFMMIEKNDKKLLEIISSKPEIDSFVKAQSNIDININKIIGIYKNPFGNRDDLNKKIIESLNIHKEKHLASLKEALIHTLDKIVNASPEFKEGYKKFKERQLEDYKNLSNRHIKEIYDVYNEEYKFDIKHKSQELFERLDNQRAADKAKKQMIIKEKENNLIISNNNDLIEKLGYYPLININIKDNKLDFCAIDKNNDSIYKVSLNIVSNSIDFFDDSTGLDEEFNFYTLEENFQLNIDKENYKKFFHSLFELNDSIICDSSSFDKFEMSKNMKSDSISLFTEKDNLIEIEKPLLFSKIVNENISNEGRLNYIEAEMKSSIKKSKLKL